MKLLSAFAACACLALGAASASAQQANPSQTPLGANVQSPLAVQSVPGGGERMPATPEVRAARQAMRASCAADMASLCADAPPPAAGGAQPGEQARGRMQCLRAHAAQLSTPCRQALLAMRDARKAAKS